MFGHVDVIASSPLMPMTSSSESRDWWSWLWSDHGLTVTGFVVGVLGLAITIGGFGLGLWRLVRIEKASKSAQQASERTRQVLRSSDLRRLLIESSSVTERIAAAGLLTPLRTALADWLAIYPVLYARLHADPQPPKHATTQFNALDETLEATRLRVLLAQEAAESRAKLSAYSLPALRHVLGEYRKAVEALLLATDNYLVGDI